MTAQLPPDSPELPTPDPQPPGSPQLPPLDPIPDEPEDPPLNAMLTAARASAFVEMEVG